MLPSPPSPPPPPPPLSTSSSLLNINPIKDSSMQQVTSLPPPAPKLPHPGPPDSVLVSLLVYNGWPFADHWEYFAAVPWDATGCRGVVVQAAGDVRAGFWLEVRRGWSLVSDSSCMNVCDGDGGGNMKAEGRGKARKVPLAWVDGRLFEADDDGGGKGERNLKGEGGNMRRVFEGGGDGEVVVEGAPRCEFERVLFKAPAPGKTLRAVTVDGEGAEHDKRTRVQQRNCQTWVVESAEQLLKEGIFDQSVLDYLRAASIMT